MFNLRTTAHTISRQTSHRLFPPLTLPSSNATLSTETLGSSSRATMTLGPQCWRCRKKRLRCDSSVPACRKCIIARAECPGYGDKRPIAFRDPLVLTQKGVVIRVRDREPDADHQHRDSDSDRSRGKTRSSSSASPPASVLGIVCRSPRTAGSVIELRIAADAMEYCG